MGEKKFEIVEECMACVDCLFLAESNKHSSEEHTRRYEEAIVERGLGNPVLYGFQNEEHFSWSSCDICKSPLGGNRYLMVFHN